MKNNSLTFKVLLDSWTLTNSVPLSDYIVSGFLSRNKDFNVAVMEVPVLFFSGTLQTYRQNMSMTFKRYFNLSLCFQRNLNLQDPFPIIHQYLLQYTVYEETIYEQVCARCTCSDLTTTPPHLSFSFTDLYWVWY
jgi:hypothetical protein